MCSYIDIYISGSRKGIILIEIDQLLFANLFCVFQLERPSFPCDNELYPFLFFVATLIQFFLQFHFSVVFVQIFNTYSLLQHTMEGLT